MNRLDKEMAQQLVEFISRETGYAMIVCDHEGVIIGDSAGERVGIMHDGAARIMRDECDSIAISAEEAQASNGRMKEGYSIAILVEAEKIGTFGIGGPLDVVTPIAKVAAAVISDRFQRQRRLKLIQNVVDDISRSIEQTALAIDKISTGSLELNEAHQAVTEAVSATREKFADTNQMLDFILDLADETGLLGLNAKIVAAQAGKYGRGFGVVAEEIRKLAKNSSSSVDRITETLEEIQSGMAMINEFNQNTATISQQQHTATRQIASDISNIKKSVETLVNIASSYTDDQLGES